MKHSLSFHVLFFFLLIAHSIPQIARSQDAHASPVVPVAQPSAQNSSATASKSDNDGQSALLGKDVPFMDPGKEVISWDGKNWNVSNNRIFQARFEKYLNMPEESSTQDQEYNAILQKIMDLLTPNDSLQMHLDEAFKSLPKASSYQRDTRLCDSIANQVYSAWSAQRSADRLAAANSALADERKRLEWNSRVVADSTKLETAPTGAATQAQWSKDQEAKRTTVMQPITTRLAEVNALLKVNQAKSEISTLQTKLEFQTLIVQLFMQRRFQHVVIATRFYRAIFSDGDTQLRIGKDAKSLFSQFSEMPPTVTVLDNLANEAMRDVEEGVSAFTFLLANDELESASKRLSESFLIGEYLPAIRTLPREKKRKALAFVHKSNQLLSAIEVRDYTLAEKLVKELEQTAKDFDNSKPMAAIETAKTLAKMHLAKAKNAASGGDKETVENELKAATEIWPRNPALDEVSGMIFSQADTQQQALVDFDQLLSQRNYRQIYDDKIRFIAATATNPEKQKQLKKILEDMGVIEAAILRAEEIEKHGDPAGAWESAERACKQFPDDNKVSRIRSDLTTKAPEFVGALKNANDMEEKDLLGSSLGWYLKAKQMYPASTFANEGIDRIVKKLYPDAK